MAGTGGYQQPTNPAPASGPGRLARRTDGGPAQKLAQLPGAQYGQQAAFAAQQKGAPLPQANPVAAAPVAGQDRQPVPFDAPTQRPDEPVTSGAALGPGPGPEALAPAVGPQQSYGTLADVLQGLSAADLTGSMAALAQQAMARGLGR